MLDVNSNPRNPVIGVRAFSDDVDLVSQLGARFVEGQQQARVVTVAKHFPGHGSVESDSHRQLPVVRRTRPEIVRELEPFRVAARAGLDAMMTAHVAVPAISEDDAPATLSASVASAPSRRARISGVGDL